VLSDVGVHGPAAQLAGSVTSMLTLVAYEKVR
jgi:hypothetical protein